ncbi:hypothetical protein [Halobacillus sp. BBL2006]|nr:hypothetical protein [Halobacillus sp. BBL2006]
MKDWAYAVYALLLAVVSVLTGEIVTFIMLGIIITSLNSIYSTLATELNH